MTGTPWTDRDTQALRRLAGQGRSFGDIAKCMGRHVGHIRQCALRYGIEVKRAVATRHLWSAKDDDTLHKLFPAYSAAEIATAIGCSVSAIYARAGLLGLRKSQGWKSERTARRWLEGRHEASRAAQFPKGHAPWNKGKPGSTGLHPNSRKTQFQKGSMTGAARRKYKPIGSLRVTRDGYLERKVTDDPRIAPARRWVAVARLVWEAEHGPIPRGHIVRFKDGMHTVEEAEITVDKLECISRVENMRRNSYHNYPAPIPQLIQLRGALNRKINKWEKKA